MARFIQAYRKSFPLISKTLIPQLHLEPNKPISKSLIPFFSNYFSTSTVSIPPFESNIIRIIGNEIDYHSEYAPSFEPVGNFEAFTVEDQPREQWVTLKGKFGSNENIKLEATMFDGYDNTGSDMKLHITLLVDISKGDNGSKLLEFACSAWPDRLEIQKVFVFSHDQTLPNPFTYTGPKFSDLDKKLQNALYEFLEERGINNQLSIFLHEYMTKKDKIEVIRWLEKLKYVMEPRSSKTRSSKEANITI